MSSNYYVTDMVRKIQVVSIVYRLMAFLIVSSVYNTFQDMALAIRDAGMNARARGRT